MNAPTLCHVCDSPNVSAAASSIGSSRCDGCAEAGKHVVSMQTGSAGSSLAVCQCGWTSEVSGPNAYAAQDRKVRMHWRAMIRAASAA